MKSLRQLAEHDFSLLEASILYFITRIPEKLNRISLCKHLYYADGHYFQKTGKTITSIEYLHIEGSPQPIFFNELLNKMIKSGKLAVIPKVVTEIRGGSPIMVLNGMAYRGIAEYDPVFTRDQLKVLNSVSSMFRGDLSLETRYFPLLYQQYVQTGLYEEIQFQRIPGGVRPHLQWKAWARNFFRLKWQ